MLLHVTKKKIPFMKNMNQTFYELALLVSPLLLIQ